MRQDTDPRYHWLDLFRFLSALTVVATHLREAVFVELAALPMEQKSAITAALFLLTRLGNEAVIGFFVLIGFLVGG